MFLLKWFTNILSSLGLYNKQARILFLGLDNAGKTTLLHMLRDDKLMIHEPTRHPQYEELKIEGITFKTHDLGGHEAARKLWKTYFTSVDGIVFLVDASESKRMDLARTELSKLLTEESIDKTPVLILGNKIDKPTAFSEPQLKQLLGVEQTTGKTTKKAKLEGQRPIEVFMCSITRRAGYAEGFRWLAEYL